jgi:HD-GYP domain-containing protein (c-di-GMP phosphodiesterase class II)
MFRKPVTSMLNLAIPLAEALDLVSPHIMNHHRRVAYIAYLLGTELNLTLRQRKDLFLAGVFHDIGAFSLQERLDALTFEITHPHEHAETGYQLLRDFKPFSDIAEIVKFHHVPWDSGNGNWFNGQRVPLESHIIHIADRISVLIPKQSLVLGQNKIIYQKIKRLSGIMFRPDLVEAFGNLAGKEHFWLDAASAIPTEPILSIADDDTIELDAEVLQSLTTLFSRVIDFRSHFTATHSSGVAASAERLASQMGFSGSERQLIQAAGHLHDLGKLVVPAEILEKPDKLVLEEWNIMRTHTFFGFRTLQKIPGLETVNVWGSLHHERLDGSGYPFHLRGEDLPLGSRIMAVADIFTALVEDRPYRKGLTPDKAVEIIAGMARDGVIDSNVVDILRSNLQEVDDYRREMAALALENYRRLFHLPVSDS